MATDLKLHVLSDLHMDNDHAPWRAPATDADVLIVAGDLFDGTEQGVEWCIEQRRRLGIPVIFVPGNHDFYGCCLQDQVAHMRERALFGDVNLLHNASLVLGGVRFVGATLWTDYCGDGAGLRSTAIHAAADLMEDFRRISYRAEGKCRLMAPADAIQEHAAGLQAINEGLADAFTESVVVITHHAPLMASLSPKFQGSALNPSMGSNLDDLVRYSMAPLWIHGHVHHSADYSWGDTRVLCNPRGHQPAVNSGFDPSLVVTVSRTCRI